MRIVLQRVKEASVAIDGQLYNEIEGGYLLLVGITEGDTEETAEKMAAKVHDLRIFEDENGKIPSLTLGKIKNGYKPLNEGVKCHFLLCKSL